MKKPSRQQAFYERMKEGGMKKISFFMPATLSEKAKKIAVAAGSTLQDWLLSAIHEKIERDQKDG